jgi:hypothetical protein
MSKHWYEVGAGLLGSNPSEEFTVTIASFPNLKDAKKYGEKFYFLQSHEQWGVITEATGHESTNKKVDYIFIDRWLEDDPDGRTIDESWGSISYIVRYKPTLTWADHRKVER